jgi:carboxymethylenebutenolidase
MLFPLCPPNVPFRFLNFQIPKTSVFFNFGFWISLLLLLVIPVRAQETGDAPPEGNSKLRGRMVSLGDFGSDDLAYLCLPEAQPRGGLILIPDKWGLDLPAKLAVDAWTKRGFIVVGVDYYNGLWSRESTQAGQYASQVSEDHAHKILTACVRLLRESPRFKMESVGLIARGTNGSWAWWAAQELKGLQAVVQQHAPPAANEKIIKRLQVPTLLQISHLDPKVSAADVENLHRLALEENKPVVIQWVETGPDFTDPLIESYSRDVNRQVDDEIEKFFLAHFTVPKPNSNWFKRSWEKLF